MQRVLITGLGVISPVGCTLDRVWDTLMSGESAVAPIVEFDTTAMSSRIAARVPNWAGEVSPEYARLERFEQFALEAARRALEDAKLDPEGIAGSRSGVILGTGMGGLSFTLACASRALESSLKRVHPLLVPRTDPNLVTSRVAIEYGLRGPQLTVSTACSSGAQALGLAGDLIRSGRADVVVAGGFEAPIVPLVMCGFDRLGVMSTRNEAPSRASRPFDKDRDGFVMGEGAALLVLESERFARARGARVRAVLQGYAASGGAHHMVTPEPDGRDASAAIRAALRDAGIEPGDVDHVNAHGTATALNDVAETRALKRSLGSRAYEIPVSATKGATGHLLGAAGALEAAIGVLALERGGVPPTLNLDEAEPECDLDYVPRIARSAELRTVLCNSFGFGNNNACLVLTHSN